MEGIRTPESIYKRLVIRSYLVRMASIYVLVARTFKFASDTSQVCVCMCVCVCVCVCSPLHPILKACWETKVGQELYKLVLVNLAFDIVGTLV
jgi:hypothetical protein